MGFENNSIDCRLILETETGVSTGLYDDVLARLRISRAYLCWLSARLVLVSTIQSPKNNEHHPNHEV